ncbi:MAG: YbaK/EbsC family protein [Rhodobacteraceae bacterium]|nr:YbaK/EbsC family protein [Paracoccaceae bacterium]
MSKSLKRVKRHAEDLNLDIEVREMSVDTHTAQQAADALGCQVDQIAKSIIFRGTGSGKAILFLTAGGNRVCTGAAEKLAGEPLGKADAALVRAQTGFAIGGVAPIGHLNPIRCFVDPHLCSFETVWAAAGTPRHLFGIAPDVLIAAAMGEISEFTE